MKFIEILDYASNHRPQPVLLNVDHVVKISKNPLRLSTEKWGTFVNTIDRGTLRVAESPEEVQQMLREAV